MAQNAARIDDTPPQLPRRRRLRRFIWFLGTALLISVTAWRAAHLARSQALADLREIDRETMTLVVSNLRVELEKLEFIPQLVARDERIQRLLQDPADRQRVETANRYLEEINRTVGASDTYVMDVAGLTLAASNWSIERSFVGESFGFRPYFQDALEGISGRYFARGTTSHKRGYYFACPIRYDGEIAGVAAVKVALEAIERTWEELPVRIVLTDWHGIVFATNQREWRYRSLRALDQRTFEAIVESRRYPGIALDPTPLVEIEPIDGSTSMMTVLPAAAEAGAVRLDSDATYLTQNQDLPEYGWVIHTMSGLRPIFQPVRDAAALGALSAGLLALTLFYFAQRRQHQRQRTSFQQREREMLQRNQEELERRIAERTEDLVRINRQLQAEIVEHQRAERELCDTQQGLVQAAKLAALGQLAAGVTHELNQPLSALRSYADNARLLIERNRLAEAGQNLERITRLSERMAGITKHLKTFARKTEPGQRVTLDVVRTLEAAVALVGIDLASRDLDLFHKAPDEPVLAVGDSIRLEQVLVNLIKNACEALDGADRRELHIDYRMSAEWVEVEIRDSGPGIALADLNSVFDPFFTTKEVGKGLGLGLSISLSIINEMGGSLRVHNHPEGGAVFVVALPRAEADARIRSA